MWPKGEFLSVREAAERAGRDPETIRRWIWRGKLRAVKAGGQYLIPPSALDDAVYFREQEKAGIRIGEPQPGYTLTPEEIMPLTPEERAEMEAEAEGEFDGIEEEDLEAERALREELFRKYGYFDVVQTIREGREDMRG